MAVIETVFAGASNSDGQLYPGFAPAGEENYRGNTGGWKLWFIDDPVNPGPEYPNSTFGIAAETLRYFVYGDPEYRLHDFDFENDVPDIARASEIIDGLNPDLSAFKRRVDGMLIWHGWADYVLPPEGIIQYYDDVLATMGGRENVDDFFRLFMMPGVVHCGGMAERAETVLMLSTGSVSWKNGWNRTKHRITLLLVAAVLSRDHVLFALTLRWLSGMVLAIAAMRKPSLAPVRCPSELSVTRIWTAFSIHRIWCKSF